MNKKIYFEDLKEKKKEFFSIAGITLAVFGIYSLQMIAFLTKEIFVEVWGLLLGSIIFQAEDVKALI